ncbi:hypothetical protein C5167_005083 [Papaver somniferum]|uniref:Uncharacterized protein n=1 Tax=Papaver somniferum TaxID=3469 RepID=A0A4Y7J9G8_PAPSO|nr:hypothetical protein C5167_005083 [Papaver somniferum]
MDEDKLEKKEGKKTFRSNLKPTVEVLEKLVFTEAQEAVLRKTKFWNFIEAIKQGKVGKAECSKAPRALEFIIRNFDPKELAFKIGDQVFKTDANHLAVIFKMQRIRMSEQDKKLYGPKEDPSLKTYEFYNKYFLEPKRRDEEEKKKDEKKKAGAKEKKRKEKNTGDKLDKKYIVEGIHTAMNEEGTEEDLAKLLLLFMFCTVFFINTGGMYVQYKYLNCLQSIDTINKVSWPDLIHEHLMQSVKAVYETPCSINGCSFYLLLWIFEQMKGINRKDNSDS